MSRYYKIAITLPKLGGTKSTTSASGAVTVSAPSLGDVWVSSSLQGLGVTDASYTSIINDQNNPSALDIEIDINAFTLNAPRQAGRVRVYGVSLGEIANISKLMGGEFWIWAGMRKPGLPLAQPHTPDLLLHGTLWQAGGAWEGGSMYIDFVVVPLFNLDPFVEAPKELVWTWGPGDDIVASLKTTLQTAYGTSYEVKGHVSSQLKAQQVHSHHCDKVSALGEIVQKITDGRRAGSVYSGITTVNGGKYAGVYIVARDRQFLISDNSDPSSPTGDTSFSKPRQIEFVDMIGQPSWKDGFTINVKTVMRGDVWPLEWMKFVQTLNVPYVVRPASASGIPGILMPSRDDSALTGTFLMTEVRHTGRFRGGAGNDWVTSIDATSQALVASAGANKGGGTAP